MSVLDSSLITGLVTSSRREEIHALLHLCLCASNKCVDTAFCMLAGNPHDVLLVPIPIYRNATTAHTEIDYWSSYTYSAYVV